MNIDNPKTTRTHPASRGGVPPCQARLRLYLTHGGHTKAFYFNFLTFIYESPTRTNLLLDRVARRAVRQLQANIARLEWQSKSIDVSSNHRNNPSYHPTHLDRIFNLGMLIPFFPNTMPKTFIIRNSLWKIEAESCEDAKRKAIEIIRKHAYDLISAEEANLKKRSLWKLLLFGK